MNLPSLNSSLPARATYSTDIEATTSWKSTGWWGREKVAILTSRNSAASAINVTITTTSQTWYQRIAAFFLGADNILSSDKNDRVIKDIKIDSKISNMQLFETFLSVTKDPDIDLTSADLKKILEEKIHDVAVSRISATNRRSDAEGTLPSASIEPNPNGSAAAVGTVAATSFRGNDGSLTPAIRLGHSLRDLSKADIETRIDKHRTAREGYGVHALTKNHFNPIVKDKEQQDAQILNDLPPIAKAIHKAKIKEEACRKVYAENLQQTINDGFFDPAIIPFDIERLLGPVEELKEPITNTATMNTLLEQQIKKFQTLGKLNKHQAHHLREDALNIADSYLKAYPEKTPQDAYFLTIDLIRIATYQEYYDKSSFNGSDHGSKHIHHNIHNASALHNGMDPEKDYNAKDKFMEKLIHFYHDVGYTVGLAGNDFDCCKDHPFIGAAMIEDNRDYFMHYLDETAYNTLHDCVLCHAIVNPNLSAGVEKEGLHPGMVRAVTSISDACAVTYDRKTQEFWEQPRALVALARLKTFLVLYPQYKGKLGDDSIMKGPWKGYDENNAWDKMAYDIFTHTKQELIDMVEEYDVPDERKGLFRQAINQQFNAFKVNVTLGQYGAVLTDVSSIPRGEKEHHTEPDYLPKFSLETSIMYGVLKDLFGEDQANEAFDKLVNEFNGDMNQIKAGLNTITAPESKQTEIHIHTGNAAFHLSKEKEREVESTMHMTDLQKNLRTAIVEIKSAFKSQYATMGKRLEIIGKLNEWHKGNGNEPFGSYVLTSLLPLISMTGQMTDSDDMKTVDKIKLLDRFSAKKPGDINPDDLIEMRNAIQLICLSEEEYQFMRGKAANVSLDALIRDGLNNGNADNVII